MLQSVEVGLPVVLRGRRQAEISDDFTSAFTDEVAVPRYTKIRFYLHMFIAQLPDRLAYLLLHEPYRRASCEGGGHANDNGLSGR